jgi:hypothetical protein
MMQPQAPPVQPAMQDAVQSANPMSIMAQPVGTAGPTPEETSDGIIDQLKTIVQASQVIAGANSQVADLMEAVQKLCIQAALKTQSQAGNQQPTAPGGY